MSHTQIDETTTAILLLCAHFSKTSDGPTRPLEPQEFSSLHDALERQGTTFASLLSDAAGNVLCDTDYSAADIERIEKLLTRGGALATSLERWFSRGLWVLTRLEAEYPERLTGHLGISAPPLLFGTGNRCLLDSGGLGIVGGRDASEGELDRTRQLGVTCAEQGITVISGGAKGVDQASMEGALWRRGRVIGVMCGDLVRTAASGLWREAIQDDALALVTPYHPEGVFTVGKAMGRNRLIHTLSDWTLVIRSAVGRGGTWAGATENLKNRWAPLLVMAAEDTPAGNAELLKRGGVAVLADILVGADFRELFDELAHQWNGPAQPRGLGDDPAEGQQTFKF